MAREFDVYLNNVGYQLLKGSKGRIPRAVSRSQYSDPFTHEVSQYERWKRVSFGFRDGSGARKYDGTARYSHGWNVDSRSGNLVTGPSIHRYMGGPDLGDRVRDIDDVDGDYNCSLHAAANDGVAVRFVTAAAGNVEILYVNILVARSSVFDYRAAANFTVELWSDAAGAPNGLLAAPPVGLKETEQCAIWFENRWLGSVPATDSYFWLRVALTYPLVNNTAYWLYVNNPQWGPVYWAKHATETASVCYNNAGWGAPATLAKPFYQINYDHRIDAPVELFASYKGADDTRKIYVGAGGAIWVKDDSPAWTRSRSTSLIATDMGVFDEKLIVARSGVMGGMEWFDGTSLTNLWSVLQDQATCLALHDNLYWKAAVAVVTASADGIAWTHNTVEVGDPGIVVSRLISHGGRLYAIKAEGVFEISYPDTYPDTGTPECNQVLDFKTDLAPRPFALDWHSGLYFPGSGGAALYEWKSGVLRDVFRERISDDGDESLLPLYDSRHGVMMACCGTTRGLIVALSTPYVSQGRSLIYFYDDRGWHPIIQGEALGEPIMAVHLESRESGVARLYWGEGLDVFYTEMPTWTDNRRDDRGAKFWYDTGAEEDDRPIVFLSEFDDGRPDMLKDWYSVRIRSDNAGTGGTEGGRVRVAYSIDDWAYLNLGYLDVSPLQELIFPANTTGYKIQFRLRWECPQNATYALAIESVDLFFQPLPDTVRKFDVALRIANNTARHRGARQRLSARQQIETLRLLLEETEPWPYDDPYGITYCVRTLGVSDDLLELKEIAPGEGTGREAVSAVRVTMLEVVAGSCPE